MIERLAQWLRNWQGRRTLRRIRRYERMYHMLQIIRFDQDQVPPKLTQKFLREMCGTEFLLGHGALAYMPDRGNSDDDNPKHFHEDFNQGVLDDFKGTFVAYWKGMICAQSCNRKRLMREIKDYHGSSNMTIFRVPKEAGAIERAIEMAIPESEICMARSLQAY